MALSRRPTLQADESKTSVTLSDGSTPSQDQDAGKPNSHNSSTGNVYHSQVVAGVNEMFNRGESTLKHSQENLHKKLDQIKDDSKVRQDSIIQKIHDADQSAGPRTTIGLSRL